MTTIVILLIGGGTVVILSAIETDPTTGQDVSILKTIQDIWNDNISLSQTVPSSGYVTPASTAGAQGITGVPVGVTPGPVGATGAIGSGPNEASAQYANQDQGQYY